MVAKKSTPVDKAVKRKFRRLMKDLDATYEELIMLSKKLPLKARKPFKSGIERLEKAYANFRESQGHIVEMSD